MSNACMVFPSANIPGFSSSTGSTPVPWPNEAYDDSNWHDSANPSRLTVPAGVDRVRVGCNCGFLNVPDNANVFVVIGRNGANTFQFRAAQTAARLAETIQMPRVSLVTGPIPVVAGDFFEVFVSTQGGAVFDMIGSNANFWIEAA